MYNIKKTYETRGISIAWDAKVVGTVPSRVIGAPCCFAPLLYTVPPDGNDGTESN